MNKLYPIFIKLDQFETLIIGGGAVGLEKAQSVLNNSPEARLTIIARQIKPELKDFCSNFPSCVLIEKAFEHGDLQGKNFVLAATDDSVLNQKIYQLCRQQHILVNVADSPDVCDFYLGSIVQKGDLKIAVSTNGKSPTVAKRLKQLLNEILPEEIDELLQNMRNIREQLKGNFAEKVKELNRITESLVKN